MKTKQKDTIFPSSRLEPRPSSFLQIGGENVSR
jgi:hypothetical protein